MTITVRFLVICLVFSFSIYGCGGGSNSSQSSTGLSSNNTSSEPSSSSPNNSSSSPNNFSSLIINPLKDLGLNSGEQVCFRVKSYNNTLESDFSKAICGKINDSNKLTLSWNKSSGDVSGYYVYFGTNKNNATNFLANVLES